MVANSSEGVVPGRDDIRVEGKRITGREQRVYLKINKPPGVVSTTADQKYRPKITDLIPDKYKKYRLHPVGRLDVDSTGLMLLTNDGRLTNLLTHPRYEVEKEYHALLNGPLSERQRRSLEKGVLIAGKRTAPAKVERLEETRKEAWYRIVLHEGRKREIRRMVERVGRRVILLRRVRIHTIGLGDLKEGEAEELSVSEVNRMIHFLEKQGVLRGVYT